MEPLKQPNTQDTYALLRYANILDQQIYSVTVIISDIDAVRLNTSQCNKMPDAGFHPDLIEQYFLHIVRNVHDVYPKSRSLKPNSNSCGNR